MGAALAGLVARAAQSHQAGRIPAIFAVTTDTFIVYTSNVFPILGLRSLYFGLAGVMDKFHYLRIGLGLVLAFVGVKMPRSTLFLRVLCALWRRFLYSRPATSQQRVWH